MKAWRRSYTHKTPAAAGACGVVPSALLLENAEGDAFASWAAASNPVSWDIRLTACGDPGTVLVSLTVDGDSRDWNFGSPGAGNFQFQIKDAAGGSECWITSNCEVFA